MFWNNSTSCDWCFTSLILSRLHKHNCMAGLSRPLANMRKADNLPVNVILKLSILRHDFRYDRQASCLLYIDSGLDCFPFLLDPFLQHYFAVCISLSERQFGVWPLLGCSSLAPHLRIIAWQHRWFSGRMLACHAGGPGSIPGRCSLTPFCNRGLVLQTPLKHPFGPNIPQVFYRDVWVSHTLGPKQNWPSENKCINLQIKAMVNGFWIFATQWFHGVMVSTLDSEASDPRLNLGGTLLFIWDTMADTVEGSTLPGNISIGSTEEIWHW